MIMNKEVPEGMVFIVNIKNLNYCGQYLYGMIYSFMLYKGNYVMLIYCKIYYAFWCIIIK